MNDILLDLVRERIATGLKRQSITSVTQWAEQYRVMGPPIPGPWTCKYHPWVKEIQDDTTELKVGQKAAQMGYTEVALNTSFKYLDIDGVNVLYVLPTKTPDASDFSTSRFDPALELSSHLSKLFTDVKNIGHKRAGSANLFIRGSRSRAQLKSVPVGLALVDELDEMVQENIAMIFERMSGQFIKMAFLLSTPTVEGHGIYNYFKDSSQAHYYFPCPCCSRSIVLSYPDCLVITADDYTDVKIKDSHIICPKCKGRLPHESKVEYLGLDNAFWKDHYADKMSRGFYINQLYSMTVKPYELAISALKANLSPTDEQEFYNSKMGLTRTVEGARVSKKDFDDAKKGYLRVEFVQDPGMLTVMGIDVGNWLHCEITQYHIKSLKFTTDLNTMAHAKVLTMFKLKHFEELDAMLMKYGVMTAVIDANPERRKSLEFAKRFPGIVKMCYYGNNLVNSKQINTNEEEHTVTVDRTSWLDLSLGRFRNHTIDIPKDTTTEYRNQVRALVRVYEKDRNDNPIGRYVHVGNDHYGHARNYAEIALPLAAGIAHSQNLSGVM